MESRGMIVVASSGNVGKGEILVTLANRLTAIGLDRR